MAVVEISRIQVRRGQENQTGVPVLESGELGWASDTENLYIGLRRVDGGSRDANVRILTENDLRAGNLYDLGFFALNSSTVYTYRQASYITTSTVPGAEVQRTLQNKLDDIVNVRDFGAKGNGIDDDSGPIQLAIDNLFFAASTGTWSNQILFFPAGEYLISETIHITKNTVLVGDGIGKTVIRQVSSGSTFFQTASKLSTPNDYFTLDNSPYTNWPTTQQADNVRIEDFTLKFNTSTAHQASFISLDVSPNSLVKNVEFIGAVSTTSVSTEVNNLGISIRGFGASGIGTSENVTIENCQFQFFNSAIGSNYDIQNIVINNNKFDNCNRGVAINFTITTGSVSSTVGPNAIKITNNFFSNIAREGIFVGTATVITSTNIISQNNHFIDVGNWRQGDEYASSTSTPVISFYTRGAVSDNDYFSRETYHLGIGTSTSTYYAPLVVGHTNIANDGVKHINLSVGSTATVIKFPLTGTPQYLTYKYHIYNYTNSVDTVDRRGTLELYVPHGQGITTNELQFTDNYNYRNSDGNVTWDLLEVNTTSNYVVLKMANFAPLGSGATFEVKNNPITFTGVSTTGTYTVAVTGGGSNYKIGDKITVLGNWLTTGTFTSVTPFNDLIIEVLTLSGSAVSTISYVGTASNIITTATFAITTGTVTNRSGGNNQDLFIDYQQYVMTT